MSVKIKYILTFVFLAAAAGVLFVIAPFDGDQNVVTVSGARHVDQMKLITPEQYRNIIRDVFGAQIKINGKFVVRGERKNGLLATGATEITLSSVGFEVADVMARSIASQVVSKRHRAELIPCAPKSATQLDDSCATEFLSAAGRLLYRRPLSDTELARELEIARLATNTDSDFYRGLEKSLAHMLVSPNFIFRIERAEPDPEDEGQYRLTAYAKASRLSFLLWNSTPDIPLLQAAENGELHTSKGLRNQVDRLLLSARMEEGVRAFFNDMLAFDQFDILTKDLNLFPKFGSQVSKEIREQTLRTIVDHLVTRSGDYRELFTTPRTFLTPSLAALLRIPLQQKVTNARPDRWLPYEFPADDPRSGLISQPSFAVLHAYPGRTSPTLRGKALRQTVLCQEVPEPPGDVDFNLVRDTSNPNYKTMRQRLSAHATQPACAGCHKITDPIGLALESFDPVGAYRHAENGVPIDTSGELDGVAYSDAAGLGKALHDSPNTVSCLVSRIYAYATGKEIERDERKWLKEVRKNFQEDGYRLKALLRRIATSDMFYRGQHPSLQKVAGR